MSNKVLALRQSEEIHLGIMEQIILDLGFAYEYYDHFKPRVPLDLKQFDYVIVLGGHMGVYQTEEYPQLHHTLEIIKEAYDLGIPLLGICLGAQLIAKAFGGKVYPNSQPEIGWYPINFLPSRHPYLTNLPEITQVFQWHNDTFSLPHGAELLASSQIAVNQIFSIGDKVLALQFHPEVDQAMLREWIQKPVSRQELYNAAITPEEIITSCTTHLLFTQRAWVTALTKNFLR